MPLFGKKETKREAPRKLSDIVLEMITRSIPEDKIITTLVETGLSEQEARKVYAQVRSEYEGYMGSKLKLEVHKLFEEEKIKFQTELKEQIRKAEKDILLKADLKAMERKESTDRKVEDLSTSTETVKSDMFNFKIQFNTALQEVQKELNRMRVKGTTKILIAVVLMLSGAAVALFSFWQLYGMLQLFSMVNIVPISILSIMIIVGAVMAKFGTDIYFAAQSKQLREYGLDWMKKEGEK